MRYAQMRKYDISNGPGVRATLFVSGCFHKCEDCFNEAYQSFEYGNLWTPKEIDTFMSYVEDDKVVGVNILGGEPLQQLMDNDLASLLSQIKQKTNKPIWLWTGYNLEDVANNSSIMDILQYVDVLIDGRFEKDLKDLNLMYRGSSNQRVIDLNYFKRFHKIKNLTI